MNILPNISKINERCLYKKMQTYINNVLSKYQCWFRKGFHAQYCLLSTIEKWKESVDNGGTFDVLMTDLSKAHELLIAKLDAYDFYIKSMKFNNTCQTENKGLKKVRQTVPGKKIFMEFDRDQSFVRLFSISFFVTYCISSKASQ